MRAAQSIDTMPMQAFYADQFVLPLPPGHSFPMSKYRLLREQLRRDAGPCAALPGASRRPTANSRSRTRRRTCRRGGRGHPERSAAARDRLSPGARRWSPARAARWAPPSAAARSALATGVAANLAGGTHHATADKGGGYCVFNDAAVAARLMQAEWHRFHRKLLRVAIVDLDVHQGNGTASIFATTRPSSPCLDARREELPLPQGAERPRRRPARRLRRRGLSARARRPRWPRSGAITRPAPPGLIFYVAGADPHEGDRLGRLKLTTAGLPSAIGACSTPRARGASRSRSRWRAATAASSTTRWRFTCRHHRRRASRAGSNGTMQAP